MRIALPRSLHTIPVSSQADSCLAEIPAGRAERAKRREGKIEGTGTLSGRVPKLLLSAHWLGGRFRHCCFEAWSAAISRNALVLLGFVRHHDRRLPDFPRFWPEVPS
ncbi:MAG: hypothetical protein H5U22_26175 [Rhizobium sp.]|nr:hypothetical protein [Rhizobium sp.]